MRLPWTLQEHMLPCAAIRNVEAVFFAEIYRSLTAEPEVKSQKADSAILVGERQKRPKDLDLSHEMDPA